MASDDWNAERIIERARPRPFRGTVWRAHWREVAATDWSLLLRTTGRYHRGLDLFPPEQTWPALYTSLAPELAIWEMVRRSAARNLAYLQNNVLSELSVDLTRVVDLADPTSAGLTTADLTGHDLRRCQDLAAAALKQELEGILVPSAALTGTNLVILPRSLSGPRPIRVVRRTELPLEILAQERPR